MKNINKVFIAVLIVLLVAIAGLSVLLVSSMKEGQEKVEVPAEVIDVVEPEIEEEDDSGFSKKKWEANYEINSDYIDKSIEQVMCKLSDSLYDIENFCMDNETRTTLGRRFPNLLWNVSSKE